ncbi:ABC transporter permease [Acidisoma silvae]|uniref:ABC transporter permease n=1 Tax=Acidisoma silvae TaxID=2802396 RepID=A0A964E0T9_9PROT|nr:ABC transporter permease [Acidisoma silvae]MCB8877499.1 ABC transporter permease [Acidisoma silvae]
MSGVAIIEQAAVADAALHQGPARRGPGFAVYASCFILALVVLAAVWPHVLAPTDPYDIDPTSAFLPPSSAHWFGTDQSGRDAFSRVIHGTRPSLLIGLLSIATALAVGGILGLAAVLGGRAVDHAVARVIDVLFAFPGLILALICIAILGASPVTLAIAVGVGSSGGYARIIRAQGLIVSTSGYVAAARMLGHAPRRILFLTILPNIARPLLPLFTLGIGQCIVWATGLSFLGLGVQPPEAEWGALLADSRSYTALAWWLTVFPGAMIAVTSLSLTILGRYLQARFDGRDAA